MLAVSTDYANASETLISVMPKHGGKYAYIPSMITF